MFQGRQGRCSGGGKQLGERKNQTRERCPESVLNFHCEIYCRNKTKNESLISMSFLFAFYLVFRGTAVSFDPGQIIFSPSDRGYINKK